MTEDRRHTASEPPPRPRSESEAFDRLQALEVRLLVYEERSERRFEHGTTKFGEHDTALADLRPKRQGLLSWASIALAASGIVFAAGRYPDRSELERARDGLVGQVQSLTGELQALEREVVRVKVELEGVETRVAELRSELGSILDHARASARQRGGGP